VLPHRDPRESTSPRTHNSIAGRAWQPLATKKRVPDGSGNFHPVSRQTFGTPYTNTLSWPALATQGHR
jgi:hypothetical protein